MLAQIYSIISYLVTRFQKLCSLNLDPSHPELRYLSITNGILIFDIAVCIAYAIHYYFNPSLNVWSFESCLIFFVVFAFLYFLNWKKHYDSARIGLIIVANIGVTAQAYILGSRSGLQDILYSLSLVPFLLFPAHKWKKTWLGILINLSCFFVYHYFLKSQAGLINSSDIKSLNKFLFLANVFVIILIGILITVNLLFKEEELVEKNEDLQKEITRRKEYENDIMYNKLLFETMFDISNDCIMLLDIDTFEILLINKRGLELFETNSLEELKAQRNGTNLRKYDLHKNELINIDNIVKTEGLWANEVEYKTLKNNIFLGEVALKVFELGSKKYRLAKITDITERKNSELRLLNYNKQLEQLTNDLRQFAHIAAHDLKSPLRSIVGHLQILQYRYSAQLDEKASEYVDFAVKAGNDLSKLIDEILRYSELNNESNANLELLDLNITLNQCKLLSQKNFAHKQVTIQFPNMPNILADKLQMLQLFQNLIENGLKYNQSTNPIVSITYSLNLETNMYKFCIKDNGIGIDTAYHKQIFDMFKRLYKKTEYEGTGIGLAICKKIVELNGGTIWVESELGKGSTFCFTIKNHLSAPQNTNELNNL